MQESKLYIKTSNKNGKTVITDSFFNAPFKIAKPFIYGNETEIMTMSATAGILKGDIYDINLDVTDNSNVKFTNQGYTKIFNTLDGYASQNVNINIGENATCKYMLHPTIPFQNSTFISNMVVRLKKSSSVIVYDTVACGRVGMGERFKMNRYHSIIKVYIDDKLSFADNTLIEPKRFNYQTIGMWNDYTHITTIYAYFPTSQQEDIFIQECEILSKKKNSVGGVTHAVKGLVFRQMY